MVVLEVAPSKSSHSRRVGEFFSNQSSARWLGGVVLLGLAFRLLVVAWVFRSVAAPGNAHAEFGFEMGWTARSLVLGHGFSAPFQELTGPTALVPPLYPYLLAGVFRLVGLYTPLAAFVILALNSLLSALTCVPIYKAAREVSGKRLARWAALGWAWYPFSIYFAAARVWDYALTAFLFACCFAAAARLHRSRRAAPWILFGVLFGVTALSNPSILIALPFLLWIASRRGPELDVRAIGNPGLGRPLLALATALFTLLPWVIHNHRTLHLWTPVRDGFWLEFYAGNLGDPNDSNSPTAHPASNPAELELYRRLGEPAYMAQKRTLALGNLEHHKVLFAVATLRRTVRFWTGFWSFSPAYLEREPLDLPNVFFCSALGLSGLVGLLEMRRRNAGALRPFLLLVAVFPLPYYITHASMDYRQPIEPELAILSTAGVLALRDRLLAYSPARHELNATELDLVAS